MDGSVYIFGKLVDSRTGRGSGLVHVQWGDAELAWWVLLVETTRWRSFSEAMLGDWLVHDHFWGHSSLHAE